MALIIRYLKFNKNLILLNRQRLTLVNYYCVKKSKETNEDDDLDPPIKFSTSKAATWKAINSFGVPENDEKSPKSPWFESLVVRWSVIVLLIYFCILREESDIDRELSKSPLERFTEIQKESKM